MSERDFVWGVGLLAGVLSVGFLLGEWAPRRFPSERGKTILARMALLTMGLGGLMGMALGGGYLASAQAAPLSPPPLLARDVAVNSSVHISAFPLDIRLDGLAAFFLFFVGFLAFLLAIYSWGWLERDPRRHWVAGAFNLFLLSMYGVILVYNMFWLLLALELMTLASGHLLLYRSEIDPDRRVQEEGRVAMRTYFIVSHISVAFLLIAVILLAEQMGTQSFTFTIRSGTRASLVDHVIFLFLLLGLGIRMGIVPFHFWVPIAHPQLPTNTHAMMSAVMLKIPVYLMIRFFIQIYPPRAWWWGGLILLLAGGTALLNVFYALVSPDLKRALAYHSVENVGIILAGVGLAVLSRYKCSVDPKANDVFQGLATLALIAALYHTLNHGLFKTLLFMGTGSIERLTGTVNLKALGGIIRVSPWTGITFLVGAMAIVGLPPLNGFISEWLTLQALFVTGEALSQKEYFLLLVLVVVALLMLGGAFALTALAFVKIVGETLLGPSKEPVREPVSRSMLVAKGFLALLCVVLGLAPGILVPFLHRAVRAVGLQAPEMPLRASWLTLKVWALLDTGKGDVHQAALSLVPAGLLVVLPLALGWIIWRLRRSRGWTSGPIWAGGEMYDVRYMRYSGTAFSFLAWEILARRPEEIHSQSPLPAYYRVSDERAVPEFFNQLYNRIIQFTLEMSEGLGRFFQSGDIRTYLLYIFVAFLIVLFTTLFLK